MVIEIKEIPTGQKIKNITFNIDFGDDGQATQKNTSVVIPSGPINRGTNDIPDEMINAEF